jgi:type IV secretory pathway VirD2 relaxase
MRAQTYRGKVLQAVNKTGGQILGSKGRFGGGKSSRGAGVARVLSGTAGTGVRARRVVVKARTIKLAGKGLRAAAAHLNYLQRDGVTREGEKGQLYGAELDQVDAKDFMSKCDEDRHQFRFIVSPEDGNQYESLKTLTRKVMAQMEQDLQTKLDWVAVDHYNTGHPHTHIVVRGRDDQGKDLVISKEYMSEGFRERVQAQVSLDLGPRSDLEIQTSRQAEITQDRLTSIDRQLLREAAEAGHVLAAHGHQFTQAVRAGRLAHLERLGLATHEGGGRWQLRADMETTLRQMGLRGDIIKTLHQALTERGHVAAVPDSQIHDGQRTPERGDPVITGRLLKRGLADEMSDRHYLIVEGTDGRVHYADIGFGDRLDAAPTGSIMRLSPNVPEIRPSDRTIVDVAARNGGYYDVEAHLKFDATARQEFAETHMRRLEAIRRTTEGVTREPDGRFQIGADYLDKALAYEVQQSRTSPMKVETLSDKSLTAQTHFAGITWLDRELTSGGVDGYATAGFGQEARTAMRARLQWLVEEGLAAEMPNGKATFQTGHLKALHAREMAATGDQISKELGLPYAPAQTGELVEGTLRKGVVLGGGKYAVVERGRDFTLVPWRPVLERHIDKTVSGLMREGGINWTIGKTPGLERD